MSVDLKRTILTKKLIVKMFIKVFSFSLFRDSSSSFFLFSLSSMRAETVRKDVTDFSELTSTFFAVYRNLGGVPPLDLGYLGGSSDVPYLGGF
jgi:hypothetical protein